MDGLGHPAPKTMLLMGGSGFVGKHVVEEMTAAGWRVDAPRSRELSLGDADALEKRLKDLNPAVVINLAALSHVDGDDFELVNRLNSEAVLVMLKVLKSCGFQGRFIQASSSFVYGNSDGTPCRETDELSALTPYAAAKISAERYCDLFRESLDICITRTFSCVGIGQKPRFLFPKLADIYREKQLSLALGTDSAKDWVDVRDVKSWYRTLCERDTVPPVINFCSGTSVAISDVLDIFARVTGHHPVIDWGEGGLVRKKDIVAQVGCTEVLQSLGLTSRYSLDDTVAWMTGRSYGEST